MSGDLQSVLHKVSASDRNQIQNDVTEVLREVHNSLRPSYDDVDRSVLLRGTLPTVHQGKTYHTPVMIRLKNYPRQAPRVKVMPTPTMQPYMRATSYRIREDGEVTNSYTDRWQHGSNLIVLVRELRTGFNAEAPLYAVPEGQASPAPSPAPAVQPASFNPEVERKVTSFFQSKVRNGLYTNTDRVIRDISDLISNYRSLTPEVSAQGGDMVLLRGTLPTNYKGSVYHIPVYINIPKQYPAVSQQGIPQPHVSPTRDMHIKPNHRNVDVAGRVYCEYLSKWNNNSHTLTALARHMIAIFEGEPPVYASQQPQRPPQPTPQRPPQAQPQAQQQQPTPPRSGGGGGGGGSGGGGSAAMILSKVQNAKVQTSDDDDTKQCIICLSNAKDVLLIPCNHICLCADCVKEVVASSNQQCPMCRKEFTDVVPGVFF